MALTPNDISSIRNTKNEAVNDVTDALSTVKPVNTSINGTVDYFSTTAKTVGQNSKIVQDLAQNVTSAVSDPFGASIRAVLSKINTLVPNIESKIDSLEKDILNKVDNKGRVSLQGNNIVITVTKSDQAQAIALENRIQASINSIQRTILNLRNIIDVFSSLTTAIQIFNTVISLEETILSNNPVSGPIYRVLKKGIKIIFLKEMISGYNTFLSSQLSANQQVLNNLANKFSSLNVSVNVIDQANSGSFINENQAQSNIVSNILSSGSNQDNIQSVSSNYGKYILKVEKYGSKELIARAYDNFTGLIVAETAPSFISTPEELLNELKSILNR